MGSKRLLVLCLVIGFGLVLGAGCGKKQGTAGTSSGGSGDAAAAPAFSLAWSEYPSWSAFGVAHEYKLIDGQEGKMGKIEQKWGVDIVLKEAEYDPCLQMYGAGQCDAVCITNMDVLNPALSVKSVAVLPTSTSDGADACIVTDQIKSVQDLKGQAVYGLAKTVSEYCFVRNLEILGENEKDYVFSNMDPGAAALAMQQGEAKYNAIVVWNPFVLETLNKRKDTRVLFDSTSIPVEIIDMVVVARASLEKPKGQDFACAVIETFYEINKIIEAPATRDEALVALGEKFSHLDLEKMKKVVEQTKFYKTAEEGIALYTDATLKATMEKVVEFCVSHDIVPKKPTVAYGEGEAQLRFDPSFMRKVAGK